MAIHCAPRSMAIAKRPLALAWSQSLAEATRMADLELQACDGSAEMIEGVASFYERRTPVFPPVTEAPAMAPEPDAS